MGETERQNFGRLEKRERTKEERKEKGEHIWNRKERERKKNRHRGVPRHGQCVSRERL